MLTLEKRNRLKSIKFINQIIRKKKEIWIQHNQKGRNNKEYLLTKLKMKTVETSQLNKSYLFGKRSIKLIKERYTLPISEMK